MSGSGFPPSPVDGQQVIVGGREFVFDAKLPGWRLTGNTDVDLSFGGGRLENIGEAIDFGDAVPLGQLMQLLNDIATEGYIPPTHVQAIPSNIWNITHNLGRRYVLVQVVGDGGNTVIPNVDFLSTTAVRLTFDNAVTGTAIVRR